MATSIITGGYVRPQPQEQAEARIRQTLKGLDELLDIKWVPVVLWNEKENCSEGRYALICRWPQADKRWADAYEDARIEPFDVLAWFCDDLQNASSSAGNIDTMEDQVIEFLGKCDNTRQPWADRMKASVAKNLKVKRAAKDEILDLAHDEFGYHQKKMAHESIVPVNNLPADMNKPSKLILP